MSSHAQVFFVITILLCMRHIIQCYKAYNFPKLWVESITKIYPCFLKTIRIYERINHKNVLFSLWRITTKSIYLFVIFILLIITCHVLGSNLNFWSFLCFFLHMKCSLIYWNYWKYFVFNAKNFEEFYVSSVSHSGSFDSLTFKKSF